MAAPGPEDRMIDMMAQIDRADYSVVKYYFSVRHGNSPLYDIPYRKGHAHRMSF
jgi:hypothetical protein